jgi:hypothetical protein
MFRIVRTIHLSCALVLGVFLSMYFVTGYVVTRRSWFGPDRPTTTSRVVELPSPPAAERGGMRFAAWMADACGVHGQCGEPRRKKDGRWEVVCARPGYSATLTVSEELRRVEVKEVTHGWQQTLVGFHRLHGYRGGWLYLVWAVVYDLASLSLIVFAVSGVVLWYMMTRRRTAGWIVLAAGLAFTIATVASMR